MIQTLKLLVIDDNESFLEVVVHYLRKNNVMVDAATDGKMGLGKFLENQGGYDAILLDIKMPVMDGFEVLTRVRETPQGASIPVIGISGSTDLLELPGFDLMLYKPFSLDKLIPAIHSLLKR